MAANLLLPKNARPPYQVVLYFPSSTAEALSSSRTLEELPWFEFLVRGGHVPSDMTSVAREALAWLDRWLGPVETSSR